MTSSTKSLYAGHRFAPELISYTVWLYFRFHLSFRDVQDLLAEEKAFLVVEHWPGGRSATGTGRAGLSPPRPG